MKVFILTISGNIYIFQNNNYSAEQITALEKIASNIITNSTEPINRNEGEIYSAFIHKAKKKLNIVLNEIEVSFVVRINQ